MAFSSAVGRGLLRSSKELLERNVSAASAVTVLRGFVDCETQRSVSTTTSTTLKTAKTESKFLQGPMTGALIEATRQYSKKVATATSKREESDSDSESDDEFEKKRLSRKSKTSLRGDSEFWRRKMRTLHRILDVNRDGVLSFDDFNLLAKRFTDLGHLKPDVAAEFMDVMKETWQEQFGEITAYNLITAEQFLTDFHHRLNDKAMVKRIARFLPYFIAGSRLRSYWPSGFGAVQALLPLPGLVR